MHTYCVALRTAPALPLAARIQAEVSFAKELERTLGGELQVVEAFAAWTKAQQVDLVDLPGAVAKCAVRWPAAALKAKRAALRRLSSVGDAHFDVELLEPGTADKGAP